MLNYLVSALDYPLSGGETTLTRINDLGQIVGVHGFPMNYAGFLKIGVTYSDVNYPLAQYTEPFGINDSGVVSGEFADGGGGAHGFVLSGGVYTQIDDPLAPSGSTHLFGIANSGEAVGYYYDGSGYAQAFTLCNGSFAAVNVPSAVNTWAYGVNASGQIVGYYDDGGHRLSFIQDGLQTTTLTDPRAAPNSTFASDINDAGVVVGSYIARNGVEHGFLYANGAYLTIDGPNAVRTQLDGVNNQGEVVGWFQDGLGNDHGLVGLPGASSVLEPSAWICLLLGLAAAGSIIRSRATARS